MQERVDEQEWIGEQECSPYTIRAVDKSVGPRLGLDCASDLERQDNVTDFSGLAIPNQLDLALVAEKKKAVGIGERLARFEQLGDIADFVGGKLHGLGFLGRGS